MRELHPPIDEIGAWLNPYALDVGDCVPHQCQKKKEVAKIKILLPMLYIDCTVGCHFQDERDIKQSFRKQ